MTKCSHCGKKLIPYDRWMVCPDWIAEYEKHSDNTTALGVAHKKAEQDFHWACVLYGEERIVRAHWWTKPWFKLIMWFLTDLEYTSEDIEEIRRELRKEASISGYKRKPKGFELPKSISFWEVIKEVFSEVFSAETPAFERRFKESLLAHQMVEDAYWREAWWFPLHTRYSPEHKCEVDRATPKQLDTFNEVQHVSQQYMNKLSESL